MAIKAIIWDVGGVLERTADFAPRQALAERLGWDLNELMHLMFGFKDGFKVQKGEISPEAHWDTVCAELRMTRPELDAVIKEFFATDFLDLELVAYIRELHGQYTTAILSNYFAPLRQRVAEEWQIGDAFDHLIISSEVGVMKPDPAIYQKALEAVGCLPEEAVFIDDFAHNVEGAQAVGMHAILFTDPEQVKADLAEILTT